MPAPNQQGGPVRVEYRYRHHITRGAYLSSYRQWFDPADKRLGRHVLHDTRSRNFDLAGTAGAKLPTELIRWARPGPVFDQGDLGCCTAAAALGLLMTEPFASGPTYTLADVHDFYSAETRIDGVCGVYPPDDTGSTGLAAMQ